MLKQVYNPTTDFSGCRFVHGKADMHRVSEKFDPTDAAEWQFMTGESGVIRGGAVIVAGTQMMVAHVDFLANEAVELAVGGGFYEMAVDAAIDEQTPVYLAESGGPPATGLVISAVAGALPAAGMLMTNLSAGAAKDKGIFYRG